MTGDAPLVSVVTPCWNAQKFLVRAWRSLCAQTESRWEWIVADDGSEDGSRATLERLAARDQRVRVLALPHSGLPAVARNRATECARGQFIAFLDADDAFHPAKLERQLVALRKHPDAGLAWSWVREWSPHARTPQRRWPRCELPEDAVRILLLRGNAVSPSSILVRREAFERIGPFNESPALRGIEDHEWIVRAAMETQFVRVAGCLVRYHMSADGLAAQVGSEHFRAMLEELTARGGHSHSDELLQAARARLHLREAEDALRSGDAVRAKERFREAARAETSFVRRVTLRGLSVKPAAALPFAWDIVKGVQEKLEGERSFPRRRR